jgi:hypothetical protein
VQAAEAGIIASLSPWVIPSFLRNNGINLTANLRAN